MTKEETPRGMTIGKLWGDFNEDYVDPKLLQQYKDIYRQQRKEIPSFAIGSNTCFLHPDGTSVFQYGQARIQFNAVDLDELLKFVSAARKLRASTTGMTADEAALQSGVGRMRIDNGWRP